jgi:hypothetical protein
MVPLGFPDTDTLSVTSGTMPGATQRLVLLRMYASSVVVSRIPFLCSDLPLTHQRLFAVW